MTRKGQSKYRWDHGGRQLARTWGFPESGCRAGVRGVASDQDVIVCVAGLIQRKKGQWPALSQSQKYPFRDGPHRPGCSGILG